MASGRAGTGSRPYRRNRAILLASNDICALCGHGGATTADHIISKKRWLAMYGTMVGFDELTNLQPAHGTMGNTAINRCPICGKLCNQSKGDRPQVINIETPHSREW